LRRADHSSQESYRLCKMDYEAEDETRAQQRAVESSINEWMKKSAKEPLWCILYVQLIYTDEKS
jgi:hypothetical protein